MDILCLHAFWICFHGREKENVLKWWIWHYLANSPSCNIYRSKTSPLKQTCKTHPTFILDLGYQNKIIYWNMIFFNIWKVGSTFDFSLLCIFPLSLNSWVETVFHESLWIWNENIWKYKIILAPNQKRGLFVAYCVSIWVFQELPNKCDYQNPNGTASL